MVDYSKLSDFEINCEVAKANNWTSKSFVHEIHSGKWNPCQNAGDAWPIILKYKISIEFDGDNSTDPQTTWCCVQNMCRSCGINYQSNPLRAAMIVFLMMQDVKNG